jgi:hypothetical protein
MRVVAVAVFVGSAITLVYGAFWVRQLQVASLGTSSSPFTNDYMQFMAFSGLVAGAWGIAAAFGLLSYRGWARISVLVFAWLCLVFCLLPMLYFPVLPVAPIQGTSPNFILYFRFGSTAFFALFVAVGIWWLYFFNKESVKEQFNGEEDEAGFKRPLGVSIVAWYLLVTTLSFTATFSYRMPLSFFGHDISLAAGRYLKLGCALVQVLAMVGLLELRRWGRALAVCYFSFLILDTMASAWVPGGRPAFARLELRTLDLIGLEAFSTQHPVTVAFGVALLLFVLPLWVVAKQKQFVESRATSAISRAD